MEGGENGLVGYKHIMHHATYREGHLVSALSRMEAEKIVLHRSRP
jgi:hypothetical protein